MEQLYDVIIIGATKESLALCQYLNKKDKSFKVLMIDETFKNKTKKYTDLKADFIKNKAIYTSFYQGIYRISIQSNKIFLGKAVVVSTGSTFIKNKSLAGAGIIYDLDTLTKTSKKKQLVICGNNLDMIEYAKRLQKKFKYVYLCAENDILAEHEDLVKEISELPNVAYLPNCKIASYKVNKNKILQEVTLDTFSKIHCQDLIGAYGRKPAISGISTQLLPRDSEGYAIINDNNESIKISTIYALGNCIRNPKNKDIEKVGKLLLERK